MRVVIHTPGCCHRPKIIGAPMRPVVEASSAVGVDHISIKHYATEPEAKPKEPGDHAGSGNAKRWTDL